MAERVLSRDLLVLHPPHLIQNQYFSWQTRTQPQPARGEQFFLDSTGPLSKQPGQFPTYFFMIRLSSPPLLFLLFEVKESCSALSSLLEAVRIFSYLFPNNGPGQEVESSVLGFRAPCLESSSPEQLECPRPGSSTGMLRSVSPHTSRVLREHSQFSPSPSWTEDEREGEMEGQCDWISGENMLVDLQEYRAGI